MGLDIVEYVTAVEEFFDVRMPDAELREVRTPRDLAEVVQRQLPSKPTSYGCLSQRAFYRVRRAVVDAEPNLERRALRPDTPCHSLSTSAEPVQIGHRWEES